MLNISTGPKTQLRLLRFTAIEEKKKKKRFWKSRGNGGSGRNKTRDNNDDDMHWNGEQTTCSSNENNRRRRDDSNSRKWVLFYDFLPLVSVVFWPRETRLHRSSHCLSLSAVGVWTSKKEKRRKYRANKTNYEIRETAATRQNKLREQKTPINGENDQLLGIRNKKTEQPPTEQT